MSRIAAAADQTLLLVMISLCGGCSPAVGTVSGNVTVDGQPLEKGFISFVAAEDAGAPITADVTGGRYSAQANVGRKRVQISAPIVTGRRPEYNGPGAPLVEITEESLPPKYNSDSELTYELPRGSSSKDWAVTSIRRAGR